jgi:hypothetical protein
LSTPFATGGCQCGAVRYALKVEPFGADFCHCRMCQRAVGNVFAAYADMNIADVEWTRGAPVTFASSTLAERGFCARCGTPLTYAPTNLPYLSVTIGSLDNPELVPIKGHNGVEDRVSWLCLDDGLPEHRSGETPAGAERLAGMVSHQSKDGSV